MTLVTTRRTPEERDELTRWLRNEADARRRTNVRECNLLQEIAEMIRPRTPEEIALTQ